MVQMHLLHRLLPQQNHIVILLAHRIRVVHQTLRVEDLALEFLDASHCLQLRMLCHLGYSFHSVSVEVGWVTGVNYLTGAPRVEFGGVKQLGFSLVLAPEAFEDCQQDPIA
jgi:hypothetical protein